MGEVHVGRISSEVGGPTKNFPEMAQIFLRGAQIHKIAKFPKIFAIFSQKKVNFSRGGPGPFAPLATPLNMYMYMVSNDSSAYKGF